MTRPSAYSYIRMSSAIQIKGDSYRRQAEASAEYAAEHDLHLIEDFKLDLGVSAFKGANLHTGALGVFVAECEAGVIPKGSFLLIESLDRLSRDDAYDALEPFLRITKAGVKIVTLVDGQIYDRSEQYKLFYAISVMIRANDESSHKSTRGLANWKKKRAAAKAGTKMSSQAPAWLKLSEDRKRFDLIPDRVKIVKEMFDLYTNGKGANLIAKHLNAKQVVPFGRGELWQEAFVDKVLKSRTVIGEFQPHKYVDGKRVPEGEPIVDYFPSIIDEGQYLLAQATRRDRGNHGGGRKGEGQTNIFTHITYCGVCGAKMRYKHKGRGHRYLTCFNRMYGDGCSASPWRYGDFEKSFLTFVRDIDLRGLADGAKRKSESYALSESLTAAEERHRIMTDRVQSYLIKAEENPDLEDVYFQRMKDLNTQAKQTASDIEGLRQRLSVLSEDGYNISDEELASFVAAFQNVSGSNRFKLAERIKQLVGRIDVYPNGVMTRDSLENFLLENEADANVRKAILDQESGALPITSSSKPQFRVTFKDGAVQVVVPDPENPEVIIVDVQAGKSGRRLSTEKFEWNATASGDHSM